jgi:hypothetical protein
MNIYRMRTSAGPKLILGVLLSACFLVAPAHAQPRVSHFRGTFVLTRDIQWGKSLLRPGTYSLAVDQADATTESIYVYDIATRKIVVAEMAAIDPNTNATNSEIVVATRGDQRAVESLQLAGIGLVFHQTHPFATHESSPEEAVSTQAIAIQTARK